MQSHLHHRRWAVLVVLSVLLGPLTGLLEHREVEAAMSVPGGFVNERAVTGLTEPTAVVWDKTGRMFVAQKGGQVRVVQNGTLLATPFVDLSAEVNPANDRGLLGIALHPDFPDTPYIYLLYVYDPPELTATSGNGAPNGNGARTSRLMRVEANSAQNYNVEKVGTRTIILGKNSTFANSGDIALDIGSSANASAKTSCTDTNNQPIEDCIPADIISHSVGTLMFAPDGSLFVSEGDASSYSFQDVRSLRAQDLNSLAGKVLRINPDTGEGYADNPFFNTAVDIRDRQSTKIGSQLCDSLADNCARVWDYGLRNPFRFTLKPGTSEVYIGDVGWSTWEEINTGKGKNFGWPCYEGNNTGSNKAGGNYPTYQGCKDVYTKTNAVTAPVYSWDHSAGGASANGGTFYTGTSYPAQYQGKEFITDYNRKWIKYITYDANGKAVINDFATEAASDDGAAQVTTGPDGNIYYVRLGRNGTGTGEIRRIRYVGGSNLAPVAQLSASAVSGLSPLKVTFSGSNSTDQDQPAGTPLLYTWDFGDGTAPISGVSASHTYTTPGAYIATLTVTDDKGTSDTDTVTINIGNTAPTATITAPTLGTKFNGGQTLNFAGTGNDAEDGAITDPQKLHWSFYLHHNEHVHVNYYPDQVGSSGNVVLPDDHGNNFWLELCLTATDKQSLSSVPTCQEYYFNTVNNSFVTDPPGLAISAGDGVEQTAPFTTPMVVNGMSQVVAPEVQQHLSFSAWADGIVTPDRFIRAGATAQTFTANYINKPPVALLAATPQAGQLLSNMTFNGALSFDPEDQTDGLSYTWSFGDGQGATGAAQAHVYPGPGSYTATLTVTDILGATSSDHVTVGVPNTLPTARIELPTNTPTYRVGVPITVHSASTDAEDGTLIGTDLKWEIIRYHSGISETLQTFTGVDGTFTVPERKQTSAMNPLLAARAAASNDDQVEIRLTALDHNGGVSTISTWLDPQRVTLTVLTNPTSLALSITAVTQRTQSLIAGSSFDVDVPETQTLNGVTYTFSNWSDGGGREHSVVVDVDMTLTASYTQQSIQPTLVWLPLMIRR